ncbi:lycopene cyclase domain-containing protein [Alcanivorax hongdengensis]|nr:lycopene cyclase domain-containing protein [Alcanivorax hongdengensis]
MSDCARALMRMVPFLLLSLLVVWGVWALQVHSSVACAAGMLAGGSYLLWRRPDLWPEALVSGALMVAVTLPVFWLLAWLSPHWVDQSWQPGLYSRWRLLGMPLGDMAFYACSGFQCGPLLAFMFDFRWQPLQRRMTVHQ